MASKEPEEKCSNTKTGEETIALEKKRSKSRRVSFAETTAIHMFIRDEECETPSENVRLHRSESDEIRELLACGDDDSDAGHLDHGTVVDTSFLRPLESPSPGSYFGSATSNDEDNFFGPVSAEFIKPGRLSDSAASDENHDVTMDSTAFSMHYRSLAMSDGGEFKTPTGARLAFVERTSGQISTTTSGEDLMILTASRKRDSGSSLLAHTVNGSGNSDDMSVVDENPHRYDYGELPPELDVLLAEEGKEEGKDVGAISLTSYVERPNSINSFSADAGSGLHDIGFQHLDINSKDIDDDHVSDMKEISNGAISAVHVNMDNGNDGIPHASLGETTHNARIGMDDNLFPVILSVDQTKTPILPANVMQVDMDEEARKREVEASGKFLSPLLSSQSNFNHEQPIAGSISSLLAKRREIFRVSPNNKLDLIVSEKEFCNKGSKHVLSASSFEKGVSGLKRREAFSFVSASKVEGNASRLMPSKSVIISSIRNKVNKNVLINNLAAPVACLDKHFSNVAEDGGGCQNMEKMGRYDLRTLGDAQFATLNSQDKSTKFTGISVSPLVLSKEKKRDPYMSKSNYKTETVESTLIDCSVLESTHNDNRVTGILDKTDFFPESSMERKVSASPLYQGSDSKNEKQQAESVSKLDQDVRHNKADDLVSGSENSTSLLIERKEEAKRSSSNVKISEIVSQEMQNDESMLGKSFGYPVIPTCFQAASIDKASESSKEVITSANVEAGTISARELAMENITSSNGLAPTLDNNQKALLIQASKSPKELSCSLLQKKPSSSTDDANAHLLVGNTVLSPRSYQVNSKHAENDQLSLKPSNDSDISSNLKRKLFDKAEDGYDEIASFQCKERLCKVQKHCEGDTKIPHRIGSDAAARDWVDVFTSFNGMTKLLPSSIHKLDMAQIRILNDVLVHLDKRNFFELLHRDFCSQKVLDNASFPQIKRLADTKWLLHRSLYEKAKLQLMHLERDILLDRVSQLDSRVDELKMLTSSCRGSGQKNVEINRFPPGYCPIDLNETILVAADIPSLRKELEVSERKVGNLNKSFHAYSKVMKELTCTEITVPVKNLIRKRVACRSLQSEFQLCQVGNIKAVDGKPNILFEHAGIMSQRFTVKSISTYGLFISNTLNNAKISKMFHGVDACSAFSFVLSGETNRVYSGFRTIAEEMQKCSSSLHTLLDVVEEVELGMIELRNLTAISFLQTSAGKLDLQICFTDFNSGARVAVTIDITCLKRGVYPSEVLPHEVQGRAARRDKSFELLLENIKSALCGVRCGYMRILSICRCISRTLKVIV
ncbi:uncharacterized protein LOC104887059 isoform X1 [Beta vulgaris subsp. vulgaris]|uniref:uncharacterized protein LOC104887059 isoform X1 n=1 Tax=Beta vulgaris subsp. vulgaris TaxID=3555 RepID=UPI00203721E7|nr:uncharacterized protein LOC104887059 isoform X1 [Beta vulgaris subsp. vulgaris]